MGILSIRPIDSKLVDDDQAHRTYNSTYQVIATYDTAPFTVRYAAGIPQRGSVYVWQPASNLAPVFDAWAFCKSVTVSHNPTRVRHPGSGASCYVWTVATVHSTKLEREQPERRENPLLDPPVIDGGFSPYRKEVNFDKDGNEIENTAKFPLTPGVSIEDAYDTLSISFKTYRIDLKQRAEFRGAVNKEPIWGFDERQVKLRAWRWSAVRLFTNDYYVQHDMEFAISYEETPAEAKIANENPGALANKKGWYTIRRNVGWEHYPDGVDGAAAADVKPVTDTKGQPLSSPAKLNDDGSQAGPNDSMKYLVFKVEPEKDFTEIEGLPDPLPGPFA